MGRGNVCTHGKYEGLYFIDRDYIEIYVKDDPETGARDIRFLGGMTAEDLCGKEWLYDQEESQANLARILGDFMYDIHAWYPSFKKCEPSYWEDGARIIMENRLYRIAVEDNEWSLAVKLLQKGDGELEGLQRGWFDKYMFAIRKSLLKYLPDIGTYTGPWTSGRITKEEFALEVIERREKKHAS